MSIRILLIEHNPDHILFTKRILEKADEDYQLDSASQAQEGLRSIIEENYDLILCDYRMPGLTALDILKEMKNRGKDLPFIAVTAAGNEKAAVDLMKEGAYDYLLKDLSYEETLPVVIKRALERYNMKKEKERTEQALQESEERYRTLVQNVPIGVYRTTPGARGKYLIANPALIKMCGFESEEDLKKVSPADLNVDPENRKAFSDNVLTQGSVSGVELPLRKKDGTPFWGSVTARVMYDENGKNPYFDCTIMDITERKKREEKLKQYQLMVEAAHDAIFFKDLKSRYIIVNNKTLEAFGLSRGQVIGKNDYELMSSQEEAKKNVEDDQLVFKSGKHTEITKHMTSAQGKEYWFEAIKVPQFDDKGNIIGLIGIARDITERKQAEEQIKRALATTQTILEKMPYGVIIVDRNKKICQINKAAQKMIGLDSEKEFVGSICHKRICPAEEGRCPVLDLGQTVDTSERILLGQGGKEIPIFKTVLPITLGDKNLLLEVFVDITDRKRAEGELKKRMHELETFQKVAVGRELKMVELKKRIDELEAKLAVK